MPDSTVKSSEVPGPSYNPEVAGSNPALKITNTVGQWSAVFLWPRIAVRERIYPANDVNQEAPLITEYQHEVHPLTTKSLGLGLRPSVVPMLRLTPLLRGFWQPQRSYPPAVQIRLP
jgi:hypothetical protein